MKPENKLEKLLKHGFSLMCQAEDYYILYKRHNLFKIYYTGELEYYRGRRKR